MSTDRDQHPDPLRENHPGLGLELDDQHDWQRRNARSLQQWRVWREAHRLAEGGDLVDELVAEPDRPECPGVTVEVPGFRLVCTPAGTVAAAALVLAIAVLVFVLSPQSIIEAVL